MIIMSNNTTRAGSPHALFAEPSVRLLSARSAPYHRPITARSAKAAKVAAWPRGGWRRPRAVTTSLRQTGSGQAVPAAVARRRPASPMLPGKRAQCRRHGLGAGRYPSGRHRSHRQHAVGRCCSCGVHPCHGRSWRSAEMAAWPATSTPQGPKRCVFAAFAWRLVDRNFGASASQSPRHDHLAKKGAAAAAAKPAEGWQHRASR